MRFIFDRDSARFREEGETREIDRFCLLPRIYTDYKKKKTVVYWLTTVRLTQVAEHHYDMCYASSYWRTIKVREVEK